MSIPETLCWGILVAGGSGTRYASDKSKLLESLGGKTVFQWSFEALNRMQQIAGIVVVTHPAWAADYQATLTGLMMHMPVLWTAGGDTRRDSVRLGLQALPTEATVVVIHDAARPLVTQYAVEAALAPVLAGDVLGTSLGYPAQNSLKRVSNSPEAWVIGTLPREAVWQVFTPQVFRKEVLWKAHQEIPEALPVHDDAELVERLYPDQPAVRMILDEPTNLKITTPWDLHLAEAILATRKTPV